MSISKKTAEQANRLREEGNELFRQENFAGAVDKYLEALKLVGDVVEIAPKSDAPLKVALKNDATLKADDCRIKCMTNIGICCLRQGRFADAVEWCTRVIPLLKKGSAKEDEAKISALCKAHFRRGSARIELGQLQLARVRTSRPLSRPAFRRLYPIRLSSGITSASTPNFGSHRACCISCGLFWCRLI